MQNICLYLCVCYFRVSLGIKLVGRKHRIAVVSSVKHPSGFTVFLYTKVCDHLYTKYTFLDVYA